MKVGDTVLCLVDCAGANIGMSQGEEYKVNERNIEEMEDAVTAGHAILKDVAPVVATAPKKSKKAE